MLLTVDRVKPTAKSLVLTCGGKEYFAKKETGITAGMTIDAETKASDYNGKTYVWVDKFKAVQNAAPQGAPAVTGASSVGTSPVGAAPWLPFASNTVAHAIAAGIITAPTMIEAWTRAAKEAFYKVNQEI